MSPRGILVFAALLLLGGGAAAYLVMMDAGEPRDPAFETRGEPAASSRTVGKEPPPKSRPASSDLLSSAPESRDPPGGASLRPKSIDDLRLPPREQGLSGIVRDSRGVEIEGARVDLYEDTGPAAGQTQEGPLRQRIVTNGTGMFVFDKSLFATTDRYVLRVAHPEYSTDVRSIDATKPSPRNLFVTLHNGTGISGAVRTVLGKPLEGVTITVHDLKRASDDPNGPVEAHAMSDGDGVFVVKGVTAGPKRILASLPGWATAALPDLTLEASKPAASLEFVLQKGSGIQGRVWSRDGVAVEGAVVIAKPLSQGEGAKKSGKASEQPAGADPIVRAISVVVPDLEEGDEEKKDPRKPAIHRPELTPTAHLQTVVLGARVSAEGSFLIDGTEFRPYLVSVSAPGFEKAADKEVTSPGDAVVFTLVRVKSQAAREDPQPRRR